MTIKTTLNIDAEIYKAAKRVAVDHDTTVSAMIRKGLLVYISDPEGIEETVSLLTDPNAMEALRAGEEARKKNRKDYYIDWEKVRDI